MSDSKEIVFNFFLIMKNDIITKIGYKTHEISGNDDQKINFLKTNLEKDKNDLIYISVPNSFKIKHSNSSEKSGISLNQYNNLVLNNTVAILFEEAFRSFDVSQTPLFISTVLKNGKITVSESIDGKVDYNAPFVTGITEEVPEYYLKQYTTDAGFELYRLMNDDFFKAIELLVNNGLFVSAIKLIVSAIDTISFLEYGDITGNFKMWLDKFCDLEKIGANSSEFWEYRNSILHMTNSSSRKVIKNEVRALAFYVHEVDLNELNKNAEYKYFNLKTFIDEVGLAMEKWSAEFNNEPQKMTKFIERYDLIVSDSRYGKIKFHK